VDERFVEAEARLGLPAVFARAFERQQLELHTGARERLLADPGFAELEPLAAQTNWDALLSVPLSYRGAALGVMALFFAPGIPIDARRRAFAQAVGDQIALMLQSARLFARAEQRNAELMVLLETSREIALTLELRELLQQLLDNLRRVVDYDGAALFASAAEGELELLCYRGPLPQAKLSWRWDLRQAAHNRAVLEGRAPVVIADVRAATPYAEAFRATAQAQLGYVPEAIGTWLGVPLLVRDRVIGLLAFDHRTPGYYTPERVALAQAFAQQAAVAVENAQLFEQARGRAALEERQRLARELHDSVSQALYGIALGARAALGAAKNNPAGLAEPLEYILGLSEAGLAEMRALIFELRPESLAEEGLVAALARQAAAAKARYELEVRTQLGAEPELSLERKEALYRIAQEAMHNAVKHAEACGEVLVLTVADDGKGFDPTAEFPGHLGQRSMRERAEAIGARLSVTSQPGAGTEVRLELPL
jgi:signal transduction histidine kinase